MFLISALLHGYRQDAAAQHKWNFKDFLEDLSERFLEIIINIFKATEVYKMNITDENDCPHPR